MMTDCSPFAAAMKRSEKQPCTAYDRLKLPSVVVEKKEKVHQSVALVIG